MSPSMEPIEKAAMDEQSTMTFKTAFANFVLAVCQGNFEFDYGFQMKGTISISLDDKEAGDFIIEENIFKKDISEHSYSIVIESNSIIEVHKDNVKQISSGNIDPLPVSVSMNASSIFSNETDEGKTKQSELSEAKDKEPPSTTAFETKELLGEKDKEAFLNEIMTNSFINTALNKILIKAEVPVTTEHSENQLFNIYIKPEVLSNSGSDSENLKAENIGLTNIKEEITEVFSKPYKTRHHGRLFPQHNSKKHKPRQCEECGMFLASGYNLRTHMNNHLGLKPFTCGVCNAKFPSQANLNFHKKWHEEKPFVCQECGSGFVNKSRLVRHSRKHSGEKPYKCEMCSKSFPVLESLKNHILIHQDLKDFKCKQCGAAFATDKSLRQHLAIHSGLKFMCSICDKGFSSKAYLISHQRIHMGIKLFKCDICDRSFGHSAGLHQHKFIHTNKKPFKCSVCSHAFAFKHSLVTHMTKHSDLKPYQCSICNRTLKTSNSLRTHRALHFVKEEDKITCNMCQKKFGNRNSLERHFSRLHSSQSENVSLVWEQKSVTFFT